MNIVACLLQGVLEKNKKQWIPFLTSRVSVGNLLLSCLLLYLLAVRGVPILLASSDQVLLTALTTAESEQSPLSAALSTVQLLKFITRSPGVLSKSSEARLFMGCCPLSSHHATADEGKLPVDPPDTGVTPESAIVATIEGTLEEDPGTSTTVPEGGVTSDVPPDVELPQHQLDPEGRVRKKRGSVDSTLEDLKKARESERRESVQSAPGSDGHKQSRENVTVKFADIEDSLQTGDLALLYRHGESQPNFAMFVNHGECDPYFPLLFVKGKTKPMPLSLFNATQRDVRVITAVTRIFYGDYEAVAVRRLRAGQKIDCMEALKVAERVENEIPFSRQEIMFITESVSDIERSLYSSTFALSHIYKELGIMLANPIDIRPDTFQDALPLSPPIYIKLPPVKPGPLLVGDPPLLSQLIDGIRPPPEFPVVTYSHMRDKLMTGDIVLFSGATSSGALIKIFDGAVFSHVGLVLRSRYSSYVLVWESSSNKGGLVDVDTGSVRKGVELLPLRNKIFSGWYNRVAIRQLTGLTDQQRDELYEKMLKIRKELQGRPYEKNHLELLMSAVNFDEGYLDFLRTDHEDLSSIFCSELVAHAYQELGLIDKTKLSNTFTPDDFASHRELKLNYGNLEPEVYINMKFDYQKEVYRQTSISVTDVLAVNQ